MEAPDWPYGSPVECEPHQVVSLTGCAVVGARARASILNPKPFVSVRRFETSAGLGGHRRFCVQVTKVRGAKDKKLVDDSELDVQPAPRLAGLMSVTKLPDDVRLDNAVEVWDLVSYVVGEVLGEHLPMSWETFWALLVNPTTVSWDAKAALMIPMVELLYVELPGATASAVFKGRPLNR